MPNNKKTDKIKRQDQFVSIIVVPRASTESLAGYCAELLKVLAATYTNYEIIIVDNNLDSEHVLPLVNLLGELPCLRILRLSTNYAYDTAIMAGIESAIGDHIVITDPNLDPIGNISKIIERNTHDDIVQGVADISKEKMLKASFGRRLFYWYSRKYLGIDVPVQSTYFIALSRRAVRAVTVAARHDVHIRHLIKVIGYSYSEYRYETKQNPIRSTSFRTGILDALDIISSHSTHPLRVMSWIGFIGSVLNLIYGIYVVAIALFRGHVAEGWTTMSLQISVMFFILFLFMIVLSEYVGKILAETRRDSRYLVMDELVSTVSIADMDRKNITKEE